MCMLALGSVPVEKDTSRRLEYIPLGCRRKLRDMDVASEFRSGWRS